MATRYVQDDEDDNAKLSGSTAISEPIDDTGGGGTGQAVSSPHKSESGSFQNLIGFLNANQDQANTMGNKVGSDINQKVTDTNSAVDTAANQFTDQVKSGSTSYDQGLVDQTIANPTGDTTQIKQVLNGSYTGPTSFEDTDLYSPVATKIDDLSTTKTLADTSGGRNELLSNSYGNNNTAKYDQFLVTNTEPAWNSVLSAINNIDPAVTNANNKIDSLDTTATQAKTDTANAATQAKNALTSARDAIQDSVEQRVTDKINAARTAQDAVATGLQSGDLSALKQLGYTDDEIKALTDLTKEASLYSNAGTDYSSYYQNNDPSTVYNASTVATKDEATQWQALNNLLNGTSNFLDPNTVSDPNTSATFNYQGLGDTLENTVLDGLAADAATKAVAAGTYKDYQTALTAAKNAIAAQKAKSTASGAAAGGEAYGAVGAVVGAVVGYLTSPGGWDDFLHSSGFTGPTMDQAIEDKNYARIGSNPAASIAAGLGAGSNTVLGKVLDPFPSLLNNSGDTSGTKLWKAYLSNSKAVDGSALTGQQANDIGAFLFGQNTGSQMIQDFANTFGITGLGNWGDGQTSGDAYASKTFSNVVNTAITQAINDGVLDKDLLGLYDGDRVYQQIVGPYIDKQIAAKTGQSNYNTWSTNTGVGGDYAKDMTAYVLSHYG